MVLHFDVGRPKSVAALEKAMMEDQRIFLVAQKDAEVDDPQLDDLCHVGTIAQIKQVLNLPGDSIRVLVEGLQRAVLGSVAEEDGYMVGAIRPVREEHARAQSRKVLAAERLDDATSKLSADAERLEALTRTVRESAEELERAFIPFNGEPSRFNGSTSAGLGLNLCASLANLWGGTVSLTSDGKETRATLTIPLKENRNQGADFLKSDHTLLQKFLDDVSVHLANAIKLI